MNVLGLDIGQIVDVGTQIAQAGAIRMGEVAGDEIFEYLISIAVLIYETDPNG